MSVPLILTILAGSSTFIGAFLGILTRKPSNRLLGFSLGFAAGIMLLISLTEMLPTALATEGVNKLTCYLIFVAGLMGYFLLDHCLPHQHAQDLDSSSSLPHNPEDRVVAPKTKNIRRTAMLLTLGISLHNFPEGIATYVTASINLDLGIGIAFAIALHNIPEGLAISGPVYAATGSKMQAIFWAGLSGMAEILGGVLAWLFLGTYVTEVVTAGIMVAVAGIMVALSIDELLPTARDIDPDSNPSYGVLCGMAVMGFSLALLPN